MKPSNSFRIPLSLGIRSRMLRACATAAGRALRSAAQKSDAYTANVQQNGMKNFQQVRGMGGTPSTEFVTYAGVSVPKPPTSHKWGAEIGCGIMWFWIFYRFYHDWETFVYGHAYLLEREIAHEEAAKKRGEALPEHH